MEEMALWGSFFSGIGALAALIISILQLKKNSMINEANFWLSLREIFNTEDRVKVHQGFRNAQWRHNAPQNNEEWILIEDYLGLFEVCQKLLEKKVISQEMFKNLYEYRIYNFLNNREAAIRKLVCEYYDWAILYQLLENLYPAKGWMSFYKFLEALELEINEVKSENEFLRKLTKAQKRDYDEFLKNNTPDNLRRDDPEF
ncbi:MAG: hypothetical protein H6581_00400 [Bacteroidia bacterium]|nr:hypothetical protein [Bacteroidia bacterium]